MSKLIYIADDEDNIRNLVKTFLKNEGHDVMDFKTGDELLEQFNIKECDLVILDIMMPGQVVLKYVQNFVRKVQSQ
ncbi:response regulator [Clostridioides difficile DA00065]|nr:response regulator [Clostridioides difficile DA00065]